MNFNRIRASSLTTLVTIALVGMSAGGASAAEPAIHNSGTSIAASVVHVSGTGTVAQTIHNSSANGGVLVGLGNARTFHETTATGGVLVDLDSGN